MSLNSLYTDNCDVIIYQSAKNAMQSGRNNCKQWLLRHTNVEQDEFISKTMNWVGTNSTKSEIVVSFDSLEEAVSYAEKHALKYAIHKVNPPKFRLKSYAENFK